MSISAILKAAGIGAAAVAGKILVDKTVDKLVGTSLDKAIDTIARQWAAGAGSNYVKATQSVRVAPYTMVDTRAARLPYIKDVMNTAQRLFTSYYSLAAAIHNTVGSVKIAKHLDRFATDRDLEAATRSYVGVDNYSGESYQFGLPFYDQKNGLDRYADYCTESSVPNVSGVGGATGKVVNDITNLAVGQLVDITITDGDKKGTIPVSIRLQPVGMDPEVMRAVLALGGTDNSMRARLRGLRVGDKTLVGDLIMQQDRIAEYRRIAALDTSGYYRKLHKRQNRNALAAALSGQPSMGDISSICITTVDTIKELEHQISGHIDDFETRQRIFDATALLLMFVIDPDHETLRVYTRDIDGVGKYFLRDLKTPGAGNNDLTEIMRSYLEGKVPGRL